MGNINNCLTVEDQAIYLHEDPQSGFFGNNPAQAYTQALPDEITLAKEPPTVPAHLGILPLNMSPIPEPRLASWTLPQPLSVTLTHVCISRNGASTTLSCTHRYRGKYVTILVVNRRIQPCRAISAAAGRIGAAAAAAAAATAGGGAAAALRVAAAAAGRRRGRRCGQSGRPVRMAAKRATEPFRSYRTDRVWPTTATPSNRPQRNVSWSSDLMDNASGPEAPRVKCMECRRHHHYIMAAVNSSNIITRSHSMVPIPGAGGVGVPGMMMSATPPELMPPPFKLPDNSQPGGGGGGGLDNGMMVSDGFHGGGVGGGGGGGRRRWI